MLSHTFLCSASARYTRAWSREWLAYTYDTGVEDSASSASSIEHCDVIDDED